jgi:hypothetical protein
VNNLQVSVHASNGCYDDAHISAVPMGLHLQSINLPVDQAVPKFLCMYYFVVVILFVINCQYEQNWVRYICMACDIHLLVRPIIKPLVP